MENITKEEIEEIETRMERIGRLREAISKKKPNQIVIGGYVNTIYKSSNDEKRVVRDRKYYREYAEKVCQELREKMKENTREVLENG